MKCGTGGSGHEHHLQTEGRGGGVRRLCREHLHRMPPPLLLLFRAPGPPPGPGSVSLLRGAAQGNCGGTAAEAGAGENHWEAGPPVLHL